MNEVPHDRPDQLEKVRAGLLSGEVLKVVFDCIGVGTGFVGLTDKRVVLQDNSFVGKKQAITSLPLRTIQSVSFVSDRSVFGQYLSSSTVAISVGGLTRTATFRGEEKARFIHDSILWAIT